MVAQINRVIKHILRQISVWMFAFTAMFVWPCLAEPVLISDDETETLLAHIVKPVFEAAGIVYRADKIHIVDDMSLNAFVSDGNHLFVHTGTLLNVANVNELFGVIAHEAGHIAGGHIMRQKLKTKDLQMLSAISLMAAGAAAVVSGRGDAAMAVALGSHGSLINSMIAYKLTEERSADESAVRYLKKIGQSPIGLKNFMKTVEKYNRLSGFEETPYFKTHPMNAEREAFFQKAAEENGGKTTSPFDFELKMVQAKLSAFLLDLDQVIGKYQPKDKSVPAKYADVIVEFRRRNIEKSQVLMDDLISKEPSNPYFHQLKGQILCEIGENKAGVQSYEKALNLKPDSNETMLLYAECAMDMPENQKDLSQISRVLHQLQLRRESPEVWALLSRVYHEQNKEADSLYAAAKYSFLIGNNQVAEKQIQKALDSGANKNLKLKLSDLQNQIESEKE